MNPFATSLRFWSFRDRVLTGLEQGHISVGAATHAETGERLTAIRVFQDGGSRELVSEYWLTADETQDLAARLLGMEPWFSSEGADDSAGRD